ncbi:MAG: HAD family hydrolase [Lacunisphaera sp.]|nr:HAD family hydrolase [Lacunisphaera sp.]
MNQPGYRHIIWDWNGTLLDDLDYSLRVMNVLLRRRGLPELNRARYHTVFDFPVRDYYARLGFDPAKDSFRDLGAEWMDGYDAHRLDCALHPDVRRIVAAIQVAGLTQSILSAYPHQTLLEIVDHFGLTPLFTHLEGLDNIYAHSKADLGRTQVAKLGLPPREILLIGDTLHDLEVAREIGVDCVLVAAGHHPGEKLRRHHDRVLDSLAELPTVLGLKLPA